jgi:hypothetical protein
MQVKQEYRAGTILSYVLIISFVLCYLIISFYNRHSADDYDGIAAVNDKGVLKAWVDQYFSWAGPFSAALIYYVFTFMFKDSTSLFLYNFLTLSVLLFSFYHMAKAIGQKVLGTSDTRLTLLSLAFPAAMFFASPRISEIWFWFCGSIEYIWPLSFLFLGIYFALDARKRAWCLCLACFFFFLLGGGAINYPLSCGMMYFLIILYTYRKYRRLDKWLWMPFIFLVLGTLVHIVAPGNYVRRSYVAHIISYDAAVVTKQVAKGILRVFVYNVFFQLPYMLCILMPFLLAGFLASAKLKERFDKIHFGKLLLVLSFLLLLIIGVHCFLLYFALGNSGGPGRTRLLLHIMYCLCITAVLFYSGVRYKEKLRRYTVPVGLLIFIGFSLFVYKTMHELRYVIPYAKAYDERTHRIEEAVAAYPTEKTETLYLKALPPSGGRTYDDPYFSDFLHRIGPLTYFLSVPNGSLEGSDIGKRRSRETDTLVDVFREDQINIRIEKRFRTPFRIDLDK